VDVPSEGNLVFKSPSFADPKAVALYGEFESGIYGVLKAACGLRPASNSRQVLVSREAAL
jgi:hypothetical protein